MRWILHLVVLLSIAVFPVKAQYNIPENNVWVFGENAGLDFNSGSPVPFITSGHMLSGSASVSDEQGNLLFYATDKEIRNRMMQVMPNGTGTQSNLLTPRGTLIIPFPGNPELYFVFTVINQDNQQRGVTGELYYSLVDMRLDNGLGDVVAGQKAIRIDSSMAGNILAARGIDCNVWLISHAQDTGIFKVYNITEAGIDISPIISYCGSFHGRMRHNVIMSYPYLGDMVISPDYLQITMAILADSNYSMGLELYDFYPASGHVSNPLLVHYGNGEASMSQAVCFSPDNNKLYTFENAIVQYDLRIRNATAINASRQIVKDSVSISDIYPFMQLGSDGKIYIPGDRRSIYHNRLHVIAQPNLDGPAAGFEWGSVVLSPGSWAEYALPNTVVKADMDRDTVVNHHIVTVCGEDSYALDIPGDAWNIRWSTGATDSMILVDREGMHVATYDGSCKRYIDSFDVRFISTTEALSFVQDKDSICTGETVTFTPFAPEVTEGNLMWELGDQQLVSSPGENIQFRFDSAGTVIVNLAASHPSCSNLLSYRDSVSVFSFPPVALIEDTSFCLGHTRLVLENQFPVANGSHYLWSTGDTTVQISVSNPGIYTLLVTVPPHCTASDMVTVTRSCFLNLPNAFTPDGDGINDYFPGLLATSGIRYFEMKIYNRWGVVLFETKSHVVRSWDGKYNSQMQSPGVYVYDIKVIFDNGVEEHHQGNFTLLR